MLFLIIPYFERPASSVRLVKSIHLRAMLETEHLGQVTAPIHKTARSVRRCKTRTKQVTAPIRKTRFALTRCFAAVLLIDWALPSWTQIGKSSCKHEIFLSMPTSNLLHKKIPWLSPGY